MSIAIQAARSLGHFFGTTSAHLVKSPVLFSLSQRVFSSAAPQAEKKASVPIHVFHVGEFGISLPRFVQEHGPLFASLPADPYDCRKGQLELLMKHSSLSASPDAFVTVRDYFEGTAPFSSIEPYYRKLSPEYKAAFDAVHPYRYRAISRFTVACEGGKWTISRLPPEPFVQKEAQIAANTEVDFRQFSRKFEELDPRWQDLSSFHPMVAGVAQRINNLAGAIMLEITLHHVRVVTTKKQITSNSPEGIHQDGYPLIVSALVVERDEVEGGESRIFLGDKVTKLFTTTLVPGSGLLQPDLGTDLWHIVTPIVPRGERGHRSSIGFDITIIK